MAKNPWNIDSAFYPMFDEEVEIVSGVTHQTFRCCVFSDITGDCITDQALETDRMDIAISVLKDDWQYLEQVHVGDIVNRVVCGKVVKYAVSSVQDDNMYGKVIKARSI